jgi:hypothetical protein
MLEEELLDEFSFGIVEPKAEVGELPILHIQKLVFPAVADMLRDDFYDGEGRSLFLFVSGMIG